MCKWDYIDFSNVNLKMKGLRKCSAFLTFNF